MKHRWVIALPLLAALASSAQDIHFTMLDLDPLLFNPAYSGFFDGTARFGIVYRNQWASVSPPFQTFSATAEWGIMRSSRNRNGISAGLWLSNDRAGSLHYGTTAASAIVSYYQGIGRSDDNIISLGAEVGIGQVGFDPDNIDLAEGQEDFERTRAAYLALGAGLAWFRQYSDDFYTKIGVSVRNINQPNISYTGMTDARLSRRYNAYARAEWRFRSDMSLRPIVGLQHQHRFTELVYGADIRWYIRPAPADQLAISVGLLARHADAVALSAAVLWQRWTFAFSYDANLSRLAAASHTIGAFEVGVTYLIPKKERRYRALPCPII